MPRGFYIRTESLKKKLRERMNALNVAMSECGRHSTYQRTAEHKKAFVARVQGVDRSGEKSHNWRGDAVGYAALHKWMSKTYGKPSLCEKCSTTSAGIFDWANITGKYLRDRADWKRLCRSCHMKEDGRGAAASKMMNEART